MIKDTTENIEKLVEIKRKIVEKILILRIQKDQMVHKDCKRVLKIQEQIYALAKKRNSIADEIKRLEKAA